MYPVHTIGSLYDAPKEPTMHTAHMLSTVLYGRPFSSHGEMTYSRGIGAVSIGAIVATTASLTPDPRQISSGRQIQADTANLNALATAAKYPSSALINPVNQNAYNTTFVDHVEAFQTNHTMLKIDGLIGPNTRAAIADELAILGQPAAPLLPLPPPALPENPSTPPHPVPTDPNKPGVPDKPAAPGGFVDWVKAHPALTAGIVVGAVTAGWYIAKRKRSTRVSVAA